MYCININLRTNNNNNHLLESEIAKKIENKLPSNREICASISSDS